MHNGYINTYETAAYIYMQIYIYIYIDRYIVMQILSQILCSAERSEASCLR